MGRILSYIVKNKKFAASTENSPANAWNLNFDTGNRNNNGKVDNSNRVRPVTALVKEKWRTNGNGKGRGYFDSAL